MVSLTSPRSYVARRSSAHIAPPPPPPRSLPPARVLPSTAVSAAAGEQRVVHKRKLESLLGELEAENESIRGTIETSRAQVVPQFCVTPYVTTTGCSAKVP
jgi:hypothetical protein